MLFNIISFFLGATFSLFLYACILSGKKADERLYNEGGKRWMKKIKLVIIPYTDYGKIDYNYIMTAAG